MAVGADGALGSKEVMGAEEDEGFEGAEGLIGLLGLNRNVNVLVKGGNFRLSVVCLPGELSTEYKNITFHFILQHNLFSVQPK